ncbi:EAL domain-containing protein [Paenibacillus methanolicus]|uniref:PAS domain S-box-containing protein/diguanylate cyclase (GGDEF)-like protein n=1 Tax=Paenibacillus methanolicus TaxID=582686 RepID=A0A5S5C2N8_9BACL|nr:EAL domain-containing protein [Paenibacillus methanolicus]TYP72742.1 PAS domain S-box-containing protein/diguanylate cyclase (GGDEF)-like protein [Paenibacillus methanolicus]
MKRLNLTNLFSDILAFFLLTVIGLVMLDVTLRWKIPLWPGMNQTPVQLTLAGMSAIGLAVYIIWRVNRVKRDGAIHRALLEHMQESVLAVNAKGKVVYSNKQMQRIFPEVRRVSRSQWLDYFGLYHVDGKPLPLQDYPSYRALRGEIMDSEHLLFKDAKQNELYLSCSANPIYGIDKRIIGAIICYQDITDRKKAEMQQEGAVRLYRSISDNLHDLLAVADANGVIDFASRSYETLLGRDPQTLKGRHVLDTIPLEHRDKLRPLFFKLTENKELVVFQHEIKDSSGTPHYFHVHASPICNSQGELERILIVSREFTEEKTFNDQLLKKERDLEHAQQIAETGNWELDLRTGVAQCSKEVHRIFDIPLEVPITFESFSRLVHQDDLHRLLTYIANVKTSGDLFEIDVRLVTLAGELKYVHFQGEFVKDASGEIERCIGIVRNVTALKLSEMELDQTRFRLEQVLNHLDIVIWSREYKSKQWLYLSPGVEKLFGVTVNDQAEGQDLFFDLVYPPDIPIIRNAFINATKFKEGITYEFRIFHQRTGQIRWIQSSSTPVHGEDGDIISIYGVSVDVTDRKRAEAMRNTQYEVLKELVRGKPLNEVLETLTQRAYEDLSASAVSIVLLDRDEDGMENMTHVHSYGVKPQTGRNTDAFDGPYAIARQERRPVWIEDLDRDSLPVGSLFKTAYADTNIRACWINPVLSGKDDKMLGFFTILFDQPGKPKPYETELLEGFMQLIALAIEQMQSKEEIQTLAFFDPLTGLGNRRHLMNELNRNIEVYSREGGGFGLLYIDLDQFKFINDSLGHDAGDEILIQIGKRLKRVGTELVLSRLGGDEFALLVPDSDNDKHYYRMARTVMNVINEPFDLSGHEFRLTGSIGISMFPDHGTDANVLLKHADNAMYQAKAAGRNQYFGFDAKLDAKAYQRFILMSELDKALSRQEFILFYQPRVELETNTVKGVEALIRWKHPQHGFISPGEFIPLAEETGFIATLGEWVLWEACRQSKAWLDEGICELRVAVNVAAQQFWDPGFVAMVRRTLHETGLDPQLLELEITESALMSDQFRMMDVLSELQELGVYVSIDDFGTGYSSLSYLKRFKVNTLKIDRSFIQDLPEDTEDAAITTTIISLARNLGLQVTAEGAERADQVEFLRQRGCDSIQGFYYGRPMPPEELVSFVQSRSDRMEA